MNYIACLLPSVSLHSFDGTHHRVMRRWRGSNGSLYRIPRPGLWELVSSSQRLSSRKEVCRMRHSVGIRLLIWGIAAALALVLGGCRVASPPATLTPTPQRGLTPHTSATPVVGATSGPVAVAVEKPPYAPAHKRVASLHTGLGTPLLARRERSDSAIW